MTVKPVALAPGVQISVFMHYIEKRYGPSVLDTWTHQLSVGWYDQGGTVKQ